MSRNAAGVYSLPTGNPVVSGTDIEADWANNTMTDVANAITDSLDRNGRGRMTVPFLMLDGTVAAPTIGFVNESTTGLYRLGAGQLAWSILGVRRMLLEATGLTIDNNATVSGNLAVTGTAAFTGIPTGPTAAAGTNTAQFATTAFVQLTAFSAALPAQLGNSGKYVTTDGTTASWGSNLAAAFGGTGNNSYTIGDILYASGATALSKLAGVATGNVLISGGVATAPAWGKVGMSTHVSGTLGAANGGTGVANNAASTWTISGSFGTTVMLTGVTTLQFQPTTGVVVGRTTTDTLTNKTLTDPALGNSNITGGKVYGFNAEVDNGNAGASKTVTMSAGSLQKLTLNNATCNLTLDWTGALPGKYTLRLIQDASGGRAVTYTAGLLSTKWLTATSAPAINTAVNGETMITMYYLTGTSATAQSSAKVGAI
jgi:hypothetical protein